MLNGANRLTQKVYDHCVGEGLLRYGMKVIVGVSGGADSVCLLKMLYEMKEALGLELSCVHIEHGIRGAESRADRDFVRNLCLGMGVDLKIIEKDVPAIARDESMSLEEAGRYVRYRAFREELEERSADVIAVAHHKGDQAETVLFNMIRGSGLKGLSGMAPVNDRIIRPLLILTRSEIEEYLKEEGQDYRIDSTNKDEGYSRNAIRNRIIPELEETVLGAADHIARCADEIREADEYIRKRAEEAYNDCVVKQGGIYRVDISSLKDREPIIRRYVVRALLTGLYSSLKDLEALHVGQILDLILKQSGRSVDLPKGITALREGGYILVGRYEDIRPKREPVCIMLNEAGYTQIPSGGTFKAVVEAYDKSEPIPDSDYTKWFDYDKIMSGVQVRNRKEGDYLTIGTGEDRKKLKKYLIDEKVPSSDRDGLLVLADGSHIVWVVGMRISEHYKVREGTGRVLKITYSDKETGNG